MGGGEKCGLVGLGVQNDFFAIHVPRDRSVAPFDVLFAVHPFNRLNATWLAFYSHPVDRADAVRPVKCSSEQRHHGHHPQHRLQGKLRAGHSYHFPWDGAAAAPFAAASFWLSNSSSISTSVLPGSSALPVNAG